MRCSQSYGFLYILILICVMFVKAYCELSKENINNFQETPKNINSLNRWNFLPVVGSNRFHKIVKKQMTVSDYLQTKKKKSGMIETTNFKPVSRIENSKKAEDNSKGNNAFLNRIPKTSDSVTMNNRFLKKYTKRSSAFREKKENSRENHQNKPISNKEENSEDLKSLVGRPCKHYVRFADKGDCHCYYECEVQSDGCMKFKHKRCPEGEIFAPEYLECLKASYLKIIRRPKRNQEPGYPKKIDVPDSAPDGDPEPANEWLDASQGTNPKIPSEFKPKRKPKLRIYHLRCKRKLNMFFQKAVPELYSEPSSVRATAKIKRQVIRRQHPRSFLVRLNKKDDSDNKDQENDENEENEENDEDDEDEGDDDDEDDTDEETSKQSAKKKESQSTAQKENLKNVYKSSVTPTEVKFDEGSSSYMNNDKTSYLSDKPEVLDESPENSKKVLIDASIKVDSAISSALKNILSKRKEKSVRSRPDSSTK